MKKKLISVILSVVCSWSGYSQNKPFYQDETQSVEKRIEDALSRMTFGEKVRILHAHGGYSSAGVSRLGILEWQYSIRKDKVSESLRLMCLPSALIVRGCGNTRLRSFRKSQTYFLTCITTSGVPILPNGSKVRGASIFMSGVSVGMKTKLLSLHLLKKDEIL